MNGQPFSIDNIPFKYEQTATSITLSPVVSPTTTTLTLAAGSSNPSTYGQSVTFDAKVAVSGNGPGIPTGSVEFFDGNPASGGLELGAAPLDSQGKAPFPTATLHVTGSPHKVYAVYSPSQGSAYISSTSQALNQTITPAPLTITANNVPKAYGDPLPSFTFSYTGFQNGDTSAGFTTQPTATTTATAASHVNLNGYSITPSGAVAPDYTFTYVSGTLTVTPVTLTITANPASKPYGAAIPTLTASYSGFVNGDTSSNLTEPPVLGTTATQSSPVVVGGYPITAAGSVDPDYAFQYVGGILTITPAVLIATANNQSMTYGDSIPTLSFTSNGLVKGDSIDAILSGSPATTATSRSHAGSYAINQGSLRSNGDYALNFTGAALTINPASLTITANDASTVYGAPLPTFTANYGGFLNGDSPASLTTPPDLTTSATSASPVGRYEIVVTGASSSDYTMTYLPGTLTITPASTKVSLALVTQKMKHGKKVYELVATVEVITPVGVAPLPSGTVAFRRNQTSLGSTSLQGGIGVLQIGRTRPRNKRFTATFLGNLEFSGEHGDGEVLSDLDGDGADGERQAGRLHHKGDMSHDPEYRQR